jgi:hypothetical protein
VVGTDRRAATTADLTDGPAGYHPCTSVRAWHADPAIQIAHGSLITNACGAHATTLQNILDYHEQVAIPLAAFARVGMPLAADAGYRGKLSNINLGGDSGISHIAINKSPKIQAEIERAIMAVSQTR